MSEENNKEYESYIFKGNDLVRYFSLHDALVEFDKLFDFNEKNDRAIAIIGATFLETILEHILWAFLIDDEKEIKSLLRSDSPLGTFSSKISMVYSLGLIYKPVRGDLHLIRKVRNKFAHDLYASFNDEKIKSWCSSLVWHKMSYVSEIRNDASVQDLFQVGVHQLVSYLHGIVSIARFQKRQIEEYS